MGCFCIEDHQFSTRTISERKLWLRAISNVKVKLQNRAPSPSLDELRHYRSAIKGHIASVKNTLEGHAPMDALLQRNMRRRSPTPPKVTSGRIAPDCNGGAVSRCRGTVELKSEPIPMPRQGDSPQSSLAKDL